MRPIFISQSMVEVPQSPIAYAPLVRYAFCVIVGVALGWWVRDWVSSWIWISVAFGCALWLLVTLCIKRWRTQLMGEGSVMSIGIGAVLLVSVAAGRAAADYEMTIAHWPNEAITWRAQIHSVHKVYAGRGVTVVAEISQYPAAYAGKRVKLYVQGGQVDRLLPGSTFVFHTRISGQSVRRNPGDWDERHYLITHGISGTAYVANDRWYSSVQPDATSWSQYFLLLRHQLVTRMSHYFEDDQLAILSALTLGDRSQLIDSLRRPFQETGTSHILALSGLHLGILYYLIQYLIVRPLRRSSFRLIAQLFALISLWLFVLLAGCPLSLQRAASMLTILQVGSFLTRSYQPTLNNLALAAILILFLSPLSLFDVGFQLSFASVLSIALMNRYVWALHPMPEWNDLADVRHLLHSPMKNFSLRNMRMLFYLLWHKAYQFLRRTVIPFFTISLSAQLGTLPLVAYYFHQLPLYGLVGNILVIPAASLLLSGSLVFFLLPFDTISSLLAKGLSFVLRFLTESLSSLAEWPAANFTVYFHPLTLLVLTLLVLTVWFFFHSPKGKRRSSIVLMGSLVCAALATEIYARRPQRVAPQIIVYNLPRAYAFHFLASADESYLLPSNDSLLVSTAWQRIVQNYWVPNDLLPPRRLPCDNFRSNSLQCDGSLFVFRGQRVLWLNRPFNLHQSCSAINSVICFVDKACTNDPASLCSLLRPCQVVLLPNLSYERSALWQEVCHSRSIPCHDMRSAGAFRFCLK